MMLGNVDKENTRPGVAERSGESNSRSSLSALDILKERAKLLKCNKLSRDSRKHRSPLVDLNGSTKSCRQRSGTPFRVVAPLGVKEQSLFGSGVSYQSKPSGALHNGKEHLSRIPAVIYQSTEASPATQLLHRSEGDKREGSVNQVPDCSSGDKREDSIKDDGYGSFNGLTVSSYILSHPPGQYIAHFSHENPSPGLKWDGIQSSIDTAAAATCATQFSTHTTVSSSSGSSSTPGDYFGTNNAVGFRDPSPTPRSVDHSSPQHLTKFLTTRRRKRPLGPARRVVRDDISGSKDSLDGLETQGSSMESVIAADSHKPQEMSMGCIMAADEYEVQGSSMGSFVDSGAHETQGSSTESILTIASDETMAAELLVTIASPFEIPRGRETLSSWVEDEPDLPLDAKLRETSEGQLLSNCSPSKGSSAHPVPTALPKSSEDLVAPPAENVAVPKDIGVVSESEAAVDLPSNTASTRHRKVHENASFVWVNDQRYQKLGKIGSGGSSQVYKVIAADCKDYALKKIILTGKEHSTALGFFKEVEYLQSLRGKRHIIQLIDFEVTNESVLDVNYGKDKITEDACIYMILEFGEIDLAHILSNKRKEMLESSQDLDVNWLRFYWEHMLKAVRTIHEERIVHADLKPANFLLVKGELKLIDFGIAKAIQSDTTTHIVRDSQVGTLNYMSPEAFMTNTKDEEGRVVKCGRASDIWSLGCILYQMVYGYAPYSRIENFYGKIQAVTSRDYKVEFLPVSSPSLLDAMKRCLTWDSHHRPTIKELLEHPFLRQASM